MRCGERQKRWKDVIWLFFQDSLNADVEETAVRRRATECAEAGLKARVASNAAPPLCIPLGPQERRRFQR